MPIQRAIYVQFLSLTFFYFFTIVYRMHQCTNNNDSNSFLLRKFNFKRSEIWKLIWFFCWSTEFKYIYKQKTWTGRNNILKHVFNSTWYTIINLFFYENAWRFSWYSLHFTWINLPSPCCFTATWVNIRLNIPWIQHLWSLNKQYKTLSYSIIRQKTKQICK